jgi:trimeric autotransporter adhesin
MNTIRRSSRVFLLGAFIPFLLTACGGGGGGGEPVRFTVTPSAGANGSIDPATPRTVDQGATTSFTITPASDYSIAEVSGCGGTLSGSTYTTGAITANCTVTASFEFSTPPAAPSLSLTTGAIKTFSFSWADVAGETEYRLLENADGSSGYSAVATIAAEATSSDLEVFLPGRVNASYIVQACNARGCTNSNTVFVTSSLA